MAKLPVYPKKSPRSKSATHLQRLLQNSSGQSVRAQRENRLLQSELFSRAALVAAGFKETDYRQAFGRVREALDAKVVRTAVSDGRFIYSDPLVDHRTRLMAAGVVFDMVPGSRAKDDTSKEGGTFVVEVVTVGADGSKTAVRVST